MKITAIHISFFPILLWLGGLGVFSAVETTPFSFQNEVSYFNQSTSLNILYTGNEAGFTDAKDRYLSFMGPLVEEVVEEVELDENDEKAGSDLGVDFLSHLAPVLGYGSFKKLLVACQSPTGNYHHAAEVAQVRYILFEVFRL